MRLPCNSDARNQRFRLAFLLGNLRNLRQLWLQRSEDRKTIAVRANRSVVGKLSEALQARDPEAPSLRRSY